MLYIRSSSLFTPTQTLKDAAILIDNGKISEVGPSVTLKAPAGAQVIDAHGLAAAPGFIDWQLNGGFGMDFTENPATIWEVAARLPEHGVTSFLPTIITAPLEVYAQAQAVMTKGAPTGYSRAQPLGLHFEGPFLNPGKKGAHNPAYLRSPSLSDTASWSRKNHLWLVTLAPELPGAHDLIRTLRLREVLVSAGHSLATYDEARAAFSAGVTCATHLFNAMPGLDHRAPGLIAALLDDPRLTVGLIPDGIHVHPAMVRLAWKLKGARGMAIVTDAMTALGMAPGEYVLGDFKVTVDKTSARLADGTLAGSILQMNAAVQNLMKFTGCTLAEAVESATFSVAQMLGARGKGRLAPGADADVVLLDEKGKLMATIVRGKMAFSRL
jgi:N-acetylglucosamine-6-phosphate deacetylase